MVGRTKLIVFALIGLGILAVGFVPAKELFFPEKIQRLQETAPAGDGGASKTLGSGAFQGKAGHSASGRVLLIEVAGVHYVRFEDFEMTSGPDVFLYLTPSSDADTGAEIGAGIRVRIDGGEGDGELTKRGTFSQRLPDGLDLDMYKGVAAWCDRFHVPFATAALA